LDFNRSTSTFGSRDLKFGLALRPFQKRFSHRDRKDHKDLSGLDFNRSTSTFGGRDLNFGLALRPQKNFHTEIAKM
jgi:hypothetical protein